MDAIREKYKQKQEAAKAKYEANKEAIASGEKKLITERNASGLYMVKFEGGGAIPESLKGWHTSIERIKQLVIAKYGSEEILKV